MISDDEKTTDMKSFNTETSPESHAAGSEVQPTTPRRTKTLQIAASSTNIPPDGVRDEPDHDFYQESAWFNELIIFIILSIVSFTAMALFADDHGITIFRFFLFLNPVNISVWTPFTIIFFLWSFILFRLMIEQLRTKWAGVNLTFKAIRAINFLWFFCLNSLLCLGIAWDRDPVVMGHVRLFNIIEEGIVAIYVITSFLNRNLSGRN